MSKSIFYLIAWKPINANELLFLTNSFTLDYIKLEATSDMICNKFLTFNKQTDASIFVKMFNSYLRNVLVHNNLEVFDNKNLTFAEKYMVINNLFKNDYPIYLYIMLDILKMYNTYFHYDNFSDYINHVNFHCLTIKKYCI